MKNFKNNLWVQSNKRAPLAPAKGNANSDTERGQVSPASMVLLIVCGFALWFLVLSIGTYDYKRELIIS